MRFMIWRALSVGPYVVEDLRRAVPTHAGRSAAGRKRKTSSIWNHPRTRTREMPTTTTGR
jgi:hypothetical protein